MREQSLRQVDAELPKEEMTRMVNAGGNGPQERGFMSSSRPRRMIGRGALDGTLKPRFSKAKIDAS